MAAFDCEDGLRVLYYIFVLVLAGAVPSLRAQQGTVAAAPLHGMVIDASGVPVAGAKVMIYRDASLVAQVRSGQDGSFSFGAPAREYAVSVQAQGFADLHTPAIPFTQGGTTKFTVLLASMDTGNPVVEARNTTSARGGAGGSPVQEQAQRRPWELGVLVEGGVGTNDRSDFRFFSAGGRAAKVLTTSFGPGLLRGDFEYGVEVFPLWQSYTPRFQKISCSGAIPGNAEAPGCSAPYTVGGTYTGVSVTPIQLRWNFTHGERWMPWLQGAGGVVWTNHKYPAIGNTNPADLASNGPSGDTSVWNFTPQFGVGTHLFLRQRRSLDFSANAVHISSASLGDKNPGVNASVQFTVGYTWFK